MGERGSTRNQFQDGRFLVADLIQIATIRGNFDVGMGRCLADGLTLRSGRMGRAGAARGGHRVRDRGGVPTPRE
jgi:hypothetical protein